MASVRFAVQSNNTYLIPTLLVVRYIQRCVEKAAIEVDLQDSRHLASPDTYLELRLGEDKPLKNFDIIPHLLQEHELVPSSEGPVCEQILEHTCKQSNS